METKLILRLRKSVIVKAKEYAQNNRISLSKMIEMYLESITSPKKKDDDITPLVESFSGLLDIDPDFDYKNDYSNYLIEKYK